MKNYISLRENLAGSKYLGEFQRTVYIGSKSIFRKPYRKHQNKYLGSQINSEPYISVYNQNKNKGKNHEKLYCE